MAYKRIAIDGADLTFLHHSTKALVEKLLNSDCKNGPNCPNCSEALRVGKALLQKFEDALELPEQEKTPIFNLASLLH